MSLIAYFKCRTHHCERCGAKASNRANGPEALKTEITDATLVKFIALFSAAGVLSG
jgi:hypothetical protein